jgi:hypothetical protein
MKKKLAKLVWHEIHITALYFTVLQKCRCMLIQDTSEIVISKIING